MGWIILLLAVLLTGLGLWRFGSLPKTALELTGAALLLGVAGYVWQGNPSLAGSPVSAPESLPLPPQEQAMLKSLGGMSAEGQWIDLSSALIRSGHTRSAVSILNGGIAKSPNNPDLWVSLGNALLVHGGGKASPASSFAFERAAALSPNHPGPPFFLGFSLAQAGKMDEAGAVWRGLLARAPDDAPWKADLEDRLRQIGQMPQAAAQ